MPGTKSKTTVRFTCAVPPLGLTATTLRTFVPPVTGTSTLKEPSAAAVVEATVVAEFCIRVRRRRRRRVFPGAVVPVTVTGEPATAALSAGLVTVSGVVPCVCAT